MDLYGIATSALTLLLTLGVAARFARILDIEFLRDRREERRFRRDHATDEQRGPRDRQRGRGGRASGPRGLYCGPRVLHRH
jgi:hypothetical protein